MNSSITSKCIKSHHLYTKLLKHLWTGLPLLFINFGKLNISRAKELVDVEKRKMWGKYILELKKMQLLLEAVGGTPFIMPKRFQITSNSRQLQRRQLFSDEPSPSSEFDGTLTFDLFPPFLRRVIIHMATKVETVEFQGVDSSFKFCLPKP